MCKELPYNTNPNNKNSNRNSNSSSPLAGVHNVPAYAGIAPAVAGVEGRADIGTPARRGTLQPARTQLRRRRRDSSTHSESRTCASGWGGCISKQKCSQQRLLEGGARCGSASPSRFPSKPYLVLWGTLCSCDFWNETLSVRQKLAPHIPLSTAPSSPRY